MSHVKFEFHSNRDTLTYFTAKNRSKSFFCIHGLKNNIEASDLVHTLIKWVSWPLLIFVMVGQFLALCGQKHPEGGVNWAPSQRKVFWTFFQHALRYQFETWYIHLVGSATHQLRVSSQPGHPDLLKSQEWVNVIFLPWWLHQMKTFSALLPFCAENSPVPVNSPHKGQWRGALIFSLIWTWINSWVNNPEVGDLRRHRAHCDVSVMHLWPQKLYRAFRFRTPWLISCSYPRHSQLTRHSLMLANGRIRQSLTALVCHAILFCGVCRQPTVMYTHSVTKSLCPW